MLTDSSREDFVIQEENIFWLLLALWHFAHMSRPALQIAISVITLSYQVFAHAFPLSTQLTAVKNCHHHIYSFNRFSWHTDALKAEKV